MINLNNPAITNVNKEQDVVEIIRLLYVFSVAHKQKLTLTFTQYYKNLNLPNGIYQTKQIRSNKYHLSTNILAFIGAFGILPNHYTKRAAISAKNADNSMINFLDAFYNLIMQLFSEIIIHFDLLECIKHYAISKTHYVPRTISNIFGIKGIKLISYEETIGPCILKNISHFSIFSKPKSLLESLLSNTFLVKTKIIEFAKEKVPIKNIDKYCIRTLGNNISLNAYYLENHIYLRQEKIDIVFYDLDAKMHFNFLNTLKQKKNLLKQILESYLGNYIKYNMCLIFKNVEASYLSKSTPPSLSINTFLHS